MFQCSLKIDNQCIENNGMCPEQLRRAKGKNTCANCFNLKRRNATKRKRTEVIQAAVDTDPQYTQLIENISKYGNASTFISTLESIYTCLSANANDFSYTTSLIPLRYQYAMCRIIMSCFCASALCQRKESTKRHRNLDMSEMTIIHSDEHSETLLAHLGKDTINIALGYLEKFIPVAFNTKFKPTAQKVTICETVATTLFAKCHDRGWGDLNKFYQMRLKYKRSVEAKTHAEFKLSVNDLMAMAAAQTRNDLRINRLWANVHSSKTQIILTKIENEHASLCDTRYVQGEITYDNITYTFNMIPCDRVDLKFFPEMKGVLV